MKIMIMEILRNIKENLTNPSTTTTLLFLTQQYTCKKKEHSNHVPQVLLKMHQGWKQQLAISVKSMGSNKVFN